MWSNLGPSPGPAEIEVSIIGPGHGESVVIHIGNGEWVVVDSCVDTTTPGRQPAALKYLQALGVPVETAVKLVIVSHWDDDHVRGIADVVRACPSARVCCSAGLTRREFISLVESVSIGSAATEKGNVGEFRQVLNLLESRGVPFINAAPGRRLFGKPRITSWSPSDHETQLFLQFVTQSHPRAGQPLRKAIPGTPNLTSVVLSIDWDDTSVLLGADMEAHNDQRRGWGAIVAETKRIGGFTKASVVKIPHHGSVTGHDDRMWSELLNAKPISVIAPFGRGPVSSRPPKSSDVRRINGLSGTAFLTAKRGPSKMQGMDVAVRRSLREGMIRLNSRSAPIGIVQLRRLNTRSWQYQLFGSARRTK